MKSTQILATALLTLTSVAYADTAPTQVLRDAANVKAGNNCYQSGKTRAEVIAELEQAQKAGLVGHKAPLMPQATSKKSRAEVTKKSQKKHSENRRARWKNRCI